MKKIFIFFSKGVLLLLLIIAILFASFSGLMYSNTTIDVIPSPDGRYNAILFVSNGGATTSLGYELSIYQQGKTISDWSRANTYSSDSPFEVNWIDEGILYVDNTLIPARKQKTFVNGITVQYKYYHQ